MPYKSNRNVHWFYARPNTSGALLFLFLLLVIGIFGVLRYQTYKTIREDNIAQIVAVLNKNVKQFLRNTETTATALSLTVKEDGRVEGFEKTAALLYKANPYLKSIQLVPGGIVKDVYPMAGNEPVIGLNLFDSKNPSTIINAERSISAKKLFYQGPVKLTQGGFGVVGRLPIFRENEFWGFSAVVIELDTLLAGIGIKNNEYANHFFQFSRINTSTNKREFFLPSNVNLEEYEHQSLYIREGDWRLDVVGEKSGEIIFGSILPVGFGLLLMVLSAFLLVKLLKKHGELARELDQQSERLYKAENKYKSIFEQASVGIARLDSTTGHFLEANTFLSSFFGYSKEELAQIKIKSLIYSKDILKDTKLFKDLALGKIDEFSSENRYVSKSGELRWGKITVKPAWDSNEYLENHILIVEDITLSKFAETRLIDAQQRVEDIINSIDGIVWECSFDEDFTSTFISKKVEGILGYSVSQWMSSIKIHFDKIHPDDRQWVKDYMKNELMKRESHNLEYRMIAKDGAVVWFRDNISIIPNLKNPAKLSGIMIDITKRKDAEDTLGKSFALVNEQNQRLLNFSHIVSHNLRSHVGNIEGISLLIESAKSATERQEMIELLKTVVFNLNDTLHNLNNIINIQTTIDIIKEPLNLNNFIVKAITVQNTQILNKKATIINKVPPDVKVLFNKAYLDSVLLNLISNAIKYSHEDRNPVITLTCFEQNNELVLRISDNGVGIDMNRYKEKIFGLYQTFNGNSDARGFGLFITKNQIEAMGGKIELQSAINQGSTFKIHFKLNK